jgi:hypothetical protein
MVLKTAFLYHATTLQPARSISGGPKTGTRLASKNGCSKDVEAVMPKARFLVTVAIAEIVIKKTALE